MMKKHWTFTTENAHATFGMEYEDGTVSESQFNLEQLFYVTRAILGRDAMFDFAIKLGEELRKGESMRDSLLKFGFVETDIVCNCIERAAASMN